MEPLLITPGGMRPGWWIELPVEEDGAPLWVRIDRLMPPARTLEARWAILVRRDRRDWWVKVAPHLTFQVCDVDPTVPLGEH